MIEDTTAPASDEQFEGEPPKSSRYWLAQINTAERTFRDYYERCDKVDNWYADLKRQASLTRDREFAMFWANMEVLKPSVYSRPPVPVVVPRFHKRDPVARTTSELLERCAVVNFEQEDINEVMKGVRDDLVLSARGVPWVRLETEPGEPKKICLEHVDRRDFLHEPARKWKEVGWVAYAAYLTRKEMRKRFNSTSGDAYMEATYSVRKDALDHGAADHKEKAKVWEIWAKRDLDGKRKVVWVTENLDVVLDESEPFLDLEGFFPCPQPAYGTLQRRSLIPVPDFAFYKDQLEEINELTARISALCDALIVRGFYPAGSGEIGAAIEKAMKSLDDRAILIPIDNWAAFGNAGAKDSIVWLPLDMVAAVIKECVEVRRQIIDDVYQVTGLSDIMRGATDPNETLGAQQLKSQYGSIRIRDRQAELVRVARDLTRIVCEILAENYDGEQLLEMSQMEIETESALEQQVSQVMASAEQQVEQALADPKIREAVARNPQAKQQALANLQQRTEKQIAEIREKPSVEEVMKLLREQRIRPFILEIETDSTIQPDENAEKQQRAEFLTTLSQLLQQLSAFVQQFPQGAAFAGEIIKFGLAPYRVGRELEGKVDEFIDQMQRIASQPKQDPEQQKLQAQAQIEQMKAQVDMAKAQAGAQTAQSKAQADQAKTAADIEAKKTDTDLKIREMEVQMQRDRQEHDQAMQAGAIQLKTLEVKLQEAQVKLAGAMQKNAIDADTAMRAEEREDRQEMRAAAEPNGAGE